jgi:hypothetical protein
VPQHRQWPARRHRLPSTARSPSARSRERGLPSGGINDSGTLIEPTVNFVGNGELHIVRDVTGSRGTFTLRIDSKVVAVEPDGSDVFSGHWVVIAGTGAYADLHGQGMRSAVVTNGVVTETLTGSVHHD